MNPKLAGGLVVASIVAGSIGAALLNLPPPVPQCARQPSDGGVCLFSGVRYGLETVSTRPELATGQCELFDCPAQP